MDVFKKNLEEFAAKHKDDIRKDPQFRLQFQEMCASIGVDPLACKYPHSAVAIRLAHLINLLIASIIVKNVRLPSLLNANWPPACAWHPKGTCRQFSV